MTLYEIKSRTKRPSITQTTLRDYIRPVHLQEVFKDTEFSKDAVTISLLGKSFASQTKNDAIDVKKLEAEADQVVESTTKFIKE